ncbi:MAG: hypothetical protein V4451_16990 [Pseudomonadota bacterium]
MKDKGLLLILMACVLLAPHLYPGLAAVLGAVCFLAAIYYTD